MLYEDLFPEDVLARHVSSWNKIALCTDPLDEDKIRSALNAAYDQVGLAPPRELLFAGSPEQGAWAASKTSSQDYVRQMVFDQVANEVDNQAYEVSYSPGFDQISNLSEKLSWETVHDLISKQVRSLWARRLRTKQFRSPFYAQHEADLFFLSIWEEVPSFYKLAPLMELAESAGWIWFYEKTAIVCARPSNIIWKGDECILVEFPDGWTATKLSPLEQLALAAE